MAIDEPGTVHICCGPPKCLLEDDAAVANQLAGCPLCKRIIINPDGTETEYRQRPN